MNRKYRINSFRHTSQYHLYNCVCEILFVNELSERNIFNNKGRIVLEVARNGVCCKTTNRIQQGVAL